ncbi:MAG: hypothetical protein FGM41_11625, partial [Bacteroidetes bacterium]|nr:hypothetical protein [Bacteroidota bacterium]
MNSNFNKFKLAKKLFLLLLLIAIGQTRILAQVSGYGFSSSTGTYTPITGGTILSALGVANDDNTYPNVPIGFTFAYNGVNYTTVGVNSNGYITMGGTPGGNFYDGTSLLNVPNSIHGFSEDLHGANALCLISYTTTGTIGSRVFTLEWKDWGFYNNTTPKNTEINFQIKLFEGSNAIQFVYQNTSPITSQTPQVGLTGTTVADYIGRTSASSWTSTSAMTANSQQMVWSPSVNVGTGLFYTFTLPPMSFTSATTTQPNLGAVVPGSTNQVFASVQVVTTGIANPLNVNQLNFSTNGTSNLAAIANAKVFYTGTNSTFAATNQFGSTTATPGATFNVTGTQTLAAGTNYFWLVYDVASGAASNDVLDAECNLITYNTSTTAVPTVQAPAGTRIVRPSLNGAYTVGSGGAYSTLTAAINEINAVGATGPVTFNLTDARYAVSTGETFPITINNIPNFCGSCGATNPILTIQPATGSSGVLIENLAANNAAIFNFNGARFVKINGKAGGSGASKTLHISNGNTLNQTIVIQNDARGIFIEDCHIKSAVTSTISAAIVIGGTTGTLGNDSIQISNNNIRTYENHLVSVAPSLANGIYGAGQSLAVQNDYIWITNNNFYNFSSAGVNVPNSAGIGAFWTISNNSFYDTLGSSVATATRTAINFVPSASATNSFGHVISDNFIGGTAPLCAGAALNFSGSSGTFTGISVSNSASASATLVTNNTINNINYSNASGARVLNGITLAGPGTYTVTGNILGHRTVANSITSANNG